MNSVVICASVVDDGEDGVESVVDVVVPTVEPLSRVDDSVVVVLRGDTAVVSVDGAVVVDSISVVEGY